MGWDVLLRIWSERRERALKKKIEAVGIPIIVRDVDARKEFSPNEKIDVLTPAILRQIGVVKRNFAKHYPEKTIHKIEFIVNDELFRGFEDTKRRMCRAGRSTHEKVLFHGTAPQNIDRYFRFHTLTHSIISHGLRVGGVDGHRAAHGRSRVSSSPTLSYRVRGLAYTVQLVQH